CRRRRWWSRRGCARRCRHRGSSGPWPCSCGRPSSGLLGVEDGPPSRLRPRRGQATRRYLFAVELRRPLGVAPAQLDGGLLGGCGRFAEGEQQHPVLAGELGPQPPENCLVRDAAKVAWRLVGHGATAWWKASGSSVTARKARSTRTSPRVLVTCLAHRCTTPSKSGSVGSTCRPSTARTLATVAVSVGVMRWAMRSTGRPSARIWVITGHLAQPRRGTAQAARAGTCPAAAAYRTPPPSRCPASPSSATRTTGCAQ